MFKTAVLYLIYLLNKNYFFNIFDVIITIMKNTELNVIMNSWRNEGLSDSEIEENLRVLKEVYIGQHIREEGILKSHFTDKKDQISYLLKEKLIIEDRWYRHELYRTTDKGAQIARKYLLSELKKHEEQINQIMNDIPPNTLKFYCLTISHINCLFHAIQNII